MSTTTALNYTSAKTFDLVQITPQVAEEYLVFNTANYRKLTPSKVRTYARDMAAGHWRFTGDPIVFDWNGVLAQGQHRLHAIIESGVTLQQLVIRGVEPEAADVMDTGLNRSAGDVLAHHGYKNGNAIAAVFNVVHCYETGLYKTAMAVPDSKAKLTNAEVMEAVEERPEMVEATQWSVGYRPSLRVPAGALALAWDKFGKLDATDRDEYFERIEGLHTGGKGDPIHTLIRRVNEYRERRESVRASTALYFLFRTWNAFRKDEGLLKLQLGSAERGWSKIPEPK